jgi:hypothetical protein
LKHDDTSADLKHDDMSTDLKHDDTSADLKHDDMSTDLKQDMSPVLSTELNSCLTILSTSVTYPTTTLDETDISGSLDIDRDLIESASFTFSTFSVEFETIQSETEAKTGAMTKSTELETIQSGTEAKSGAEAKTGDHQSDMKQESDQQEINQSDLRFPFFSISSLTI